MRGVPAFLIVFGNLNNGVTNGGASCFNGNNTLDNANWNILGRLSVIRVNEHYAILAAAKIETNPLGW